MSLVADLRGRVADFALTVRLETHGTLALVGPNGAGKSTALRALLGVIPVEGTLSLDGRDLVGVPTEDRQIGYVPQDGGLFPHLDVARNVAFGLPRGQAVAAVLADFGLEALAGRRPKGLSGGERQRVALARAVAPHPRALLLDEPLAALDVDARTALRAGLRARLGRLAIPCVVVSHDPAEVRALADEVAVMEAGEVVQCGTPDELAADPASAFVRAFFG